MNKTAVITGVSGHAASYLAEVLLKENVSIYGTYRRSATPNHWRIKHILPQISLIEMDLLDDVSIKELIRKTEPDYFFNVAAQSFVASSFNTPVSSIDMNGQAVVRMLEGLREYCPHTKFIQFSTSELFGSNSSIYHPQNEKTPFMPASAYGLGKILAYYSCEHYSRAYGLKTYNPILFNMESPRRGIEFVTRKISNAVARIQYQEQDWIELGNLYASRDWNATQSSMEGVWKLANQDKITTAVFGSGKTHTVKEFVEKAFLVTGTKIHWFGTGIDEIGKDQHGRIKVKISKEFYRPNEVSYLLSDPSLAIKELNWNPDSSPLDKIIEDMVRADLYRVERGIQNEI